MKPARTSAKPDYHRIVTCATLATITSLGMFSLVANIMATLLGGMTGRTSGLPTQEVRVSLPPSVVCADSARAEGAASLPLQAI